METTITTRLCAHCGQPFEPRPQVPDQAFCSAPECQRARKRDWQRAKLQNDKPIDLFKIKSKDKGKPEHEARLAAYGALVVTQQRAGLYSMPCAAAVLA